MSAYVSCLCIPPTFQGVDYHKLEHLRAWCAGSVNVYRSNEVVRGVKNLLRFQKAVRDDWAEIYIYRNSERKAH